MDIKLRICPYCLAEMKSRGEKVKVIDHEYEENTCQYCSEQDDEFYIVEF